MDIKLEMQKKVILSNFNILQVYNDKQNLFKVILGQHQFLTFEEFKTAFERP